MAKMYEYYATQDVRPTFANLKGSVDLARYVCLRANVFRRLTLPAAFFAGKQLLEFGPDTGENSLVFATWGAQLTLVEPSTTAHEYIWRYFMNFGLETYLTDVVARSVLEFEPSRRYDIVDAEGFIYTVQPTSAWIAKMDECLTVDGHIVVSYTDTIGSLLELLLKAIYTRVSADPAYGKGVTTVRRVFSAKWDSIPHTRTIESWFMDVIDNPFVRLRYFIDPVELLTDMHAAGFRLYSSWPNYRDMLAVYWLKRPYSADEDLRSACKFIERSRLSHCLGEECFLPEPSSEITSILRAVVDKVDSLIDESSADAALAAEAQVDTLIHLVAERATALSAQASVKAAATLSMVRSILHLMATDATDELIDFCQNDEVFIVAWGAPGHHAVFDRSPV